MSAPPPSKPWADEPWPLLATPSKLSTMDKHAAIYITKEMIHIHNAIIRGMNCIYLQAPHVHRANDITDLLVLGRIWSSWIESHHQSEENNLFPQWEEMSGQAGLMNGNLEQHLAFEPHLKKFAAYVVETTPEAYDANTLRGHIDGFAPILRQHLADEIETLIKLSAYDSDKVMAIYKRAEKAAASVPLYEYPSLVLGLADSTFEGGVHPFPPLPKFVRYAIHYWFGRRHAGSWRFLPCDTFGQPRPLPFLGSPDSGENAP